MLSLDNKTEWQKLNNAFENAEEIPSLIQKLLVQYDSKLLIELNTEYLSHQMSVYTATFAAFPYLILLIEQSKDQHFKLNTFISSAILLVEFDVEYELDTLFQDCTCDAMTITDIKNSFIQSLNQLPQLASALIPAILDKDETEKRFFLLALAIAYQYKKVASMLWQYSENDEYLCTCPNCEATLYLWNEPLKTEYLSNEFLIHAALPGSSSQNTSLQNISLQKNHTQLVVYTADPVFHLDQTPYFIQRHFIRHHYDSHTSNSERLIPTDTQKMYTWLTDQISKLEIQSLVGIVDDLFGLANCPHCQSQFIVFEQLD